MEQLNPQLAQGIEQYFKPRQEGDLDLVTEVRTVLIESGLLPQVVAHFDTHRFIIEAANKPSSIQRYLLNRYWDLQLMTVKGNIEERFCLIPNGEVSDWFKLFKSKILPFIISNNLPITI